MFILYLYISSKSNAKYIAGIVWIVKCKCTLHGHRQMVYGMKTCSICIGNNSKFGVVLFETFITDKSIILTVIRGRVIEICDYYFRMKEYCLSGYGMIQCTVVTTVPINQFLMVSKLYGFAWVLKIQRTIRLFSYLLHAHLITVEESS